MKYIKEYFNSHKKILSLLFLILIILIPISYLIASYATNVLAIHDNDDEYTITITENSSNIAIEAHSSVVVYYKIINTNSDTVQYAIGYTTEEYDSTNVNDTSLGVYIKGYDNDITGLIDQNETKFIKLKIFNQTDNDDIVNLSTILGYETGGNLIVPEGVTLIDSIITEASAVWYFTFAPAFANTNIPRNSIATITIANDSVVPAGYTNYMVLDSVQGQNKSIVAWWKPNDNNSSLIDLYVGSDYGKVYTMPQPNMMFAQLGNATSLDLANLDTSHTIDMQSMFYNSRSLISLDLSSFDTSHVTSMKSMFGNCTNLTTIDLSSFNTGSVNTMEGMFSGCSSLTSLNLSNFNTGSVNTMESMFQECSSLNSLDIRNMELSNTTLRGSMFTNMPSGATIYVKNSTEADLVPSGFNVVDVTTLSS